MTFAQANAAVVLAGNLLCVSGLDGGMLSFSADGIVTRCCC
jgi:Zn-dependent protease